MSRFPSNWRTHLADWRYALNVLDRLRSGLQPSNGCWEWSRTRTSGGYGQISVKHAMVQTHQVAYHLFIGPVPAGLQLDHLCRNRACANPWHLDPVTSAVNSRRGLGALNLPDYGSRTHCVNGHAFDQVNTYIHPVTGYRTCRNCRADRERSRQQAIRRAA